MIMSKGAENTSDKMIFKKIFLAKLVNKETSST